MLSHHEAVSPIQAQAFPLAFLRRGCCVSHLSPVAIRIAASFAAKTMIAERFRELLPQLHRKSPRPTLRFSSPA
jgi:hypothetical protein